jgi:hypothetical protein
MSSGSIGTVDVVVFATLEFELMALCLSSPPPLSHIPQPFFAFLIFQIGSLAFFSQVGLGP